MRGINLNGREGEAPSRAVDTLTTLICSKCVPAFVGHNSLLPLQSERSSSALPLRIIFFCHPAYLASTCFLFFRLARYPLHPKGETDLYRRLAYIISLARSWKNLDGLGLRFCEPVFLLFWN